MNPIYEAIKSKKKTLPSDRRPTIRRPQVKSRSKSSGMTRSRAGRQYKRSK